MKVIEPALKIARPCSADWNGMAGDERKRFCEHCGKHVFNLSAMTVGEAQAFADETQGRECVAYVTATDGLIHAPNKIERMVMRLSGKVPRIAAMLAIFLPAALASCTDRNHSGGQVTPGTPMPPPDPLARQARLQSDGTMTLGMVCLPSEKNK